MPFLGFNYGESKGLERVLSARIKMGKKKWGLLEILKRKQL